MYDLKHCPLCDGQYLEETRLIEYRANGKYYYDIKNGDWCHPNDMYSKIIQKIDQIIKEGMSMKELCIKLMENFDLTAKTACNYTKWLIETLPVYLPDRKHIRFIPT
jgi:Zn-finger protein